MAKIPKNVLKINQLLEEKKVDKLKREEKNKLVKQFIKEFQKNNRVEIKAYKEAKDIIN